MLTRKQYELLVYIDRHLKQTGFSPSFEEMKDALNLKSKSGIHRLISALEERGYLARRHHRARALDVLRLPDNMLAGKRRYLVRRILKHRRAFHRTSFAAISLSVCRVCALPATWVRSRCRCMVALLLVFRSRRCATPTARSRCRWPCWVRENITGWRSPGIR